MNAFKLLFLTSLLLSELFLLGCGRKGPLYPPEKPMGNEQSDQAFIFPPTQKNETNTLPKNKDTQ